MTRKFLQELSRNWKPVSVLCNIKYHGNYSSSSGLFKILYFSVLLFFNFLLVYYEHFFLYIQEHSYFTMSCLIIPTSGISQHRFPFITFLLRLGHIFLFLLMFSNFLLYPGLNFWVLSVEILDLLCAFEKSLLLVLAGNLLGWTQFPNNSGKQLKSLFNSSNFLAGLCEVYPAHVQFRSFRCLERISVYIQTLLLWLYFPRYPLFTWHCCHCPILCPLFLLDRKTVRSIWGLATDSGLPLGENKQTQKQETHPVLISSYKYRLPSSFCLLLVAFQCLQTVVSYIFFSFS